MQENELRGLIEFCYLSEDFFDELRISEYGSENCKPGKIVPLAKKNYYLFHYIIKGKGVFKVNGKSYRLKQNDLFCIFRDNSIEYIADEQEPWSYIWVGLSGTKCLDLLHLAGIWEDQPIIKKVGSEVAECFLEIKSEMELHGKADLRVYSLIYKLLFSLQEHAHIVGKPLSQQEIWVRKACVYIFHNCNLQITVDDVARAVDLSGNYLCRLFKSILNCTVRDYLTQSRMMRAKDLLQKTAFKVQDIAKYVGYKDRATFMKAFKRYVGKTPEEYRQTRR